MTEFVGGLCKAVGLTPAALAAGAYKVCTAAYDYVAGKGDKTIEMNPKQVEVALVTIADANERSRRSRENEMDLAGKNADLQRQLDAANAQNQQLREGATKTASQNYRLKVAVGALAVAELATAAAALWFWKQGVGNDTREV